MVRFGFVRFAIAVISITGLAMPFAAHAQFSQGYEFLEAVEKRDGAKATELLDKPGSTIVNARNYSSGETALHIVAQRNDTTWTGFLLKRGADPNIRDKQGVSPLMVAVSYRNIDVVEILLRVGAKVDLQNSAGETPLIRAVQLGDLALVRMLLKKGADPDKVDSLAGQSARDYATNDSRKSTILEAIEKSGEAEAEPDIKIFGPKLN